MTTKGKPNPMYTAEQIRLAVELAIQYSASYASRATNVNTRAVYRYLHRLRSGKPVRGVGERAGYDLYLTLGDDGKVHTRLESRDCDVPEKLKSTPDTVTEPSLLLKVDHKLTALSTLLRCAPDALTLQAIDTELNNLINLITVGEPNHV